MRHIFLIGDTFHKVHAQFIKEVVDGEYLEIPCSHRDEQFSKKIYELDGEGTVWFFSDIYPHLHKHLKGKQIHIGHGLSFKKKSCPKKRESLKKYFDAVFCNGPEEFKRSVSIGISKSKLHPIGYGFLLSLPKREVRPKHVLFSSTSYDDWNHYGNLKAILRQLPKSYQGHLTFHPHTNSKNVEDFASLCAQRQNLTLIPNQEELLKAISFCEMAVGGSSSVLTPFWFLKKPVIFLKGWTKAGRNPLSGFGWYDIRQKNGSELFNQILNESQRVSHWMMFTKKVMKNAKWAPSSESVFYAWNHDRSAVAQRIKQAIKQVLDQECLMVTG